MSVSDTIPIQLHDCEAYLEGTIIHIRPKTMDRLLSEVAPSQDSPSSNNLSSHAEPELHEDCDSPGQMIRDAEQTQQERMMQFGQSQFSSLADFTHNVIDSALADSVTTVPIYTTQTSPLVSVAQTQVDTSTTMTATTLETTPISPAETIILTTENITQTTTSTHSQPVHQLMCQTYLSHCLTHQMCQQHQHKHDILPLHLMQIFLICRHHFLQQD